MTEIFLPLRSNAAWFADHESHAGLVRRFKRLLLFYDSVVVEDGRYVASFVADGASDHFLAPAQIRDRSKICYRNPGTGFEVRVARGGSREFTPIISGPLEAGYEVDFWPVLSEAGITSADCVRWVNYELTTECKELVRRAVFRARLDPSLEEGLPSNRFLRNKIVESLHADAMLAAGLDMPLSIDKHAATVVQRANASAATHWSHDARASIADVWLTLGLPDPSADDWDVVLKARDSAAGADLRQVIGRLSAHAVLVLSGAVDSRDWQDEAKRLLYQELLAEVFERRATITDVALNLGLSLIPYVGTPMSTGQDVARLVREHRSWVSLLGGLGRGVRVKTQS